MHHNELPTDSSEILRYALENYGDSVFRLACAQTGNINDAEDVSQDVFLRLLSTTIAFESTEHLKAWLLRVAINRCHDLTRQRARRLQTPFEELPHELQAPHDESNNCREELAEAWEAIQKLPEDQRVVMHLVCIEEYSPAEAGKILGVTPGAIRSRLSRARKSLRAAREARFSKEASEAALLPFASQTNHTC